MAAIENEHIYAVQIRESANDGSDFTNPDADYRHLFLGEDGLLHVKDSAGTVTSPYTGGSVATDAIWDAAGDLVQGTGADTAARLAVGAAGTILGSTGSAAAWQGAWGAWTPALTATSVNPTMGTGSSVAGRYAQIGKTVEGWGRVTFGSSGVAAGTGQYLINFPVTPTSSSQHVMGSAVLLDSSTSTFSIGAVYTNDTSTFRIAVIGAGVLVASNVAPWTWAANDAIYVEFKYEAA